MNDVTLRSDAQVDSPLTHLRLPLPKLGSVQSRQSFKFLKNGNNQHKGNSLTFAIQLD